MISISHWGCMIASHTHYSVWCNMLELIYHLSKSFVKFFWDDNGYLFWSCLLICVLAIRFAFAFNDYNSKSGLWVGIARGCGADLNILMMILPLTMMKSTHTRLREIQFILKYFPIDEMIEIHISLSKLAVGFTLGHVICSF